MPPTSPSSSEPAVCKRLAKSFARLYAHTVLRPLLHIDPRASFDVSGRYELRDAVYAEEPQPVRISVIGDSCALGLGVRARDEAPAGVVARSVVRELGRPVDLQVCAAVGTGTFGLARCVAKARQHRPHVALFVVGGNDTLLPLPVRWAARRLGGYVSELAARGTSVVVTTSPDTGSSGLFSRPVRAFLTWRSRRTGALQAVHAVRHGARVASLADPAFRERPHELLSADRFHPSAAGYARQCARIALDVVAAAGGPAPEDSARPRELPLRRAARLAARTQDAHLTSSTTPGRAVLSVRPPGAAAAPPPSRARRGAPQYAEAPR
ncbi:GDSL-type esterase/lipase family protein [Streptomyces sp. ODS28]|uniref:GDSL-type esterase/lipase family protein n=1 Tax=Streptomyces sp. ODS28 TaxID=3136688 RepID=UPI0031E8B2EA